MCDGARTRRRRETRLIGNFVFLFDLPRVSQYIRYWFDVSNFDDFIVSEIMAGNGVPTDY